MTKRDEKISADVSSDAKSKLIELCEKFDRSRGYMLERMINRFHAETFGEKSETEKAATKVKRTVEKVPANFDEQFELLWVAKGRKGSKKKACEKYRAMAKGNNSEVLEQFTQMLIANIEDRNKTELGAPEQHLITYLNGQFWES